MSLIVTTVKSRMPKKKASAKAAVKAPPFSAIANQDYPFSKWETEGSACYDKLKTTKAKLTKYELHLLHNHFPQQAQQFATQAAQRRRKSRQQRNASAGLAGADTGAASDSESSYARPATKVIICI